MRLKMKSQLATVISGITLNVMPLSERFVKLAWCQIAFKRTDYTRTLTVYYECARRSRNDNKDKVLFVLSADMKDRDQLDLFAEISAGMEKWHLTAR